MITDGRWEAGNVYPKPYALAVPMAVVAVGIIILATSDSFVLLLLAAPVLGVGSALFHPEASRVCCMASGGKLGFAQSSFQVGGNTGTALGPLPAISSSNPAFKPALSV
ncbi:hypothetical protein ACEN2J_18140 [Pseudorhodobacter sp. W20_MBD10_FR17]|uniref:hypothetical protein n=1 Tax=Pseudorhodobacter sp. W20_MBD10_FR17 TaxID=3240266 RepID=UPI003F9C8B3F